MLAILAHAWQRSAPAWCHHHGRCRQKELELEAAEEEALAARVEAAVQERLAAAMGSEEVLARIARRLTEERAKLEERVGLCAAMPLRPLG